MKIMWKAVDGMVVIVVGLLLDTTLVTNQVVFANALIRMHKHAKQSRGILAKRHQHIMEHLTMDALELIVLGVNTLVVREHGTIAM